MVEETARHGSKRGGALVPSRSAQQLRARLPPADGGVGDDGSQQD
jgi:hypothetical protein